MIAKTQASAAPSRQIPSRRAVIRATVLAATALFAARGGARVRAQDDTDDPFDPGGRVRVDYDEAASFNEMYGYPPLLGRSESWRLRVYAEPDDDSAVIRPVSYDQVLPIYQAVHGVAPSALQHNDVWYDLGDGYIHSSYIVPVHEIFNEPEAVIGDGFWGEITVPTSWQHWEPQLRSRRYYDLAYGTVYRVVDRADEADGRAWYRIVNDIAPRSVWWVQASHVRRIQPEEFAPISPDVPPDARRVEVNIRRQLLTCYEDSIPVFSTRIASGTAFVDAEGRVHHFNTPYGSHRVTVKMPSRHMIGGEDINDVYDLPGVPWCTFFTASGAAIHGTYWHNDFGRPRSHGCINVTNDAAHWVYRWVLPVAEYGDDRRITAEEETLAATAVIVEP